MGSNDNSEGAAFGQPSEQPPSPTHVVITEGEQSKTATLGAPSLKRTSPDSDQETDSVNPVDTLPEADNITSPSTSPRKVRRLSLNRPAIDEPKATPLEATGLKRAGPDSDEETNPYHSIHTQPGVDRSTSRPTFPRRLRQIEGPLTREEEELFGVLDKYHLESDDALRGAIMEHFLSILGSTVELGSTLDAVSQYFKFQTNLRRLQEITKDIPVLRDLKVKLFAIENTLERFGLLQERQKRTLKAVNDVKARYPYVRQHWGFSSDNAGGRLIREDFGFLGSMIRNMSRVCLKIDISLELATSRASKVFENVTMDVPKFLMNRESAYFVFEAGIWDYLITKVFPRPLALAGGRFIKMLAELCYETQPPIPTAEEVKDRYSNKNKRIEEYHEFRARFARIVARHVYPQLECFPPEREREIKESENEIASEMLATFLPFIEDDRVKSAEHMLQGLLNRVGMLQRRFLDQREVYEIHMAANVNALDQRHGFSYNGGEMVAVGEHFGLLSLQQTKVDFVVSPLLMYRGHVDEWMGVLQRLDTVTLMTQPRVLLERHPERNREFDGYTMMEQARSWSAAAELDPGHGWPVLGDELFTEDGLDLREDLRPRPRPKIDSTQNKATGNKSAAKSE